MEGTTYIEPVDLIPSEYEVDVKRPGHFSIKNGNGFCMNLFTDLEYRRMRSTSCSKLHGLCHIGPSVKPAAL